MLAKDFISEQLQQLAASFPMVQIKYRYEKTAETHIVELTPVHSYYNDPSLENGWMAIAREFMERFPQEDLSFISSDSILRIDQPELSFNALAIPNYHLLSNTFTWDAYFGKVLDSFLSDVDFQHISLPDDLALPLPWERLKVWDTLQSFHYDYHAQIGYAKIGEWLADWPLSSPTVKSPVAPVVSKDNSFALAA